MKEHRLFDAITDLPDGVVAEAEIKKPRRFRRWYIPAVAAALALCFFLGSALWPDGATIGMVANAAYLAEYPDRAQLANHDEPNYNTIYSKWSSENMSLALPESYDKTAIENFTRQSVVEFLGGSNGENRLYSPVNVYMVLAMLAEVTDGNSRRQVLELLGEESIDSLRRNVNTLWNNVYRNDGRSTVLLANSIWMRDDIGYIDSTLKTLAENYYASSFTGKMGSSDYNSALRDWMNQNTKNLLKEQIDRLSMDKETVMALVSTVYYKDRWSGIFKAENNTQDIFHTNSGDTTVTFMNQTSKGSTYYWSSNFSATVKYLGQTRMWLVLPDEGVAPEELLEDDIFWNTVQGKTGASSKVLELKLSVPKFDISDQTGLIDGIRNMGVTDVFETGQGDFSNLTNEWPAELLGDIEVSQITHGARLKIDEEGAEGAAYTMILAGTTSAPQYDYAELILDRPFIVVLTNTDNVPIFFGIVHNP